MDGKCFTNIKILCSKSNAWIVKAVWKNEKIILKIFKPSKLYNGSYQNEYRILKHLSQFPTIDFIQKLIGSEVWTYSQVVSIVGENNEKQDAKFPVLITNYCGRDLYSTLIKEGKRFTESMNVIETVAKAVNYFAEEKLPLLHRIANVIHCDIKAENLTYHPKEGKCYLIDFGSAILVGEKADNLWNERSYPYYNTEVTDEDDRDEYATGLVLYYITHQGRLPKDTNKLPELYWETKYKNCDIGYEYCSCVLFLED